LEEKYRSILDLIQDKQRQLKNKHVSAQKDSYSAGTAMRGSADATNIQDLRKDSEHGKRYTQLLNELD